MKRLFAVLVLALLVFYVAWPGLSAYRMANALSSKDTGTLEQTVDFPAVRDSLRPVVTTELGTRIDAEITKLGTLGQALGSGAKAKMLPRLVDQVLATLVTSENAIRFANDGQDIAKAVEGILGDAAGQIGAVAGGVSTATGDGASAKAGAGLGGMIGGVLGAATGSGDGTSDSSGIAGKILGGISKPAATAAQSQSSSDTTPTTAKRTFGIGNIKGISLAGPLSFNVAVARDAAQSRPDATIGMSFTGGGWKLTRVVPNM